MNRLAHGIVLRRFSITARVAAVSDPFKVLGVSRRASKKDIHNAYLKKCMKCHPDLFPNSAAKSEEFSELQSCYERLMNWEKEKPHFDNPNPGSSKKQKMYHSDESERPAGINWHSDPKFTTTWNSQNIKFGDDNIIKNSQWRMGKGLHDVRNSNLSGNRAGMDRNWDIEIGTANMGETWFQSGFKKLKNVFANKP